MMSNIKLSLLFLAFGCGNNVHERVDIKRINSDNLIESNFERLELNQIDTIIFPPPININEIKHRSNLGSTSGVMPLKETQDLCREDSTGFFGEYYLFSNDAPFGKLVVFVEDSDEGWNFETADETFVAIILTTNEVMVWDSIGVGTPLKDLKAFLSNDINYQKGTIVFAELGEYSASFTVKGDTISRVEVWRYCKVRK